MHLRVGPEFFYLGSDAGKLTVRRGPAPDGDAVVTMSTDTLYSLLTGQTTVTALSGTAPSTATPGSPAAPWSRSPQPEPAGTFTYLETNRHSGETLMSEIRSKTARAAAPGGAAAGGPRPGLALLVLATAQLMVVLDATIVNVALPHIQRALGFSGTNLEWVVNAYALTFGGLLLLGGRAGDLLGRRKMFIAGLLLFSAASLAGGFADSQAFLLTARAVQGAGGALVAPAALSLITTTFAEGPPRTRAFGVYAAMSIAGGAIGLIGGGLLTTYASWRWVLFVNVPIGAAVALAAPRVLAESPRRRGRFDLPGAITGTAGVAALVYGLISAATSANGVSHWGDAKVIASLAAAAVLLAAFAVIETRSRYALLPVRLLRDRNRTGAYLSYAGVGIFIFGMFFFLTVFMQAVWGYSP